MIEVVKPGVYTTIQDQGRYGYQASGIVVSGVMDKRSYELGNIILQQQNAPTFEFVMTGPTLKFHQSAVITITGAAFQPTIDGQQIPMWRPVQVLAGSILAVGSAKRGMYGYLFVKGLDIPQTLGSTSTYEKAGLGKRLQKGDTFHVIPSSAKKVNWSLKPLNFDRHVTIRVVKGTEYNLFTEASLKLFFNTLYIVTTQANRMGYRLQGVPLQQKVQHELLSSAVTYGTIQVPSNGQPIVLMADRQTTGGYAKIAQVISADLSKLAQCMPGTTILFKLISLEEAQTILIREHRAYQLLKKIIHY